MQSIPCRSFGLVAAISKFKAGESVTNDPLIDGRFVVGSNFGFVWMYTKGRAVFVNEATGEQIESVAGDNLITNPIPMGEWILTAPEDFEVVCYSPFLNEKNLPIASKLTPFILQEDASTLVPHMTQLFLAQGSIEVDGKVLQGPRQILFKSGDKTVVAVAPAYGFIVKQQS